MFGIQVSTYSSLETTDKCCYSKGADITASDLPSHGYSHDQHDNFPFSQLSPAVPIPLSLRPLPASLKPEDITYLHTKGALNIPTPQLQNALLRAYIEFVHPYLPVIDVINFITVLYHPDGSKGKISFALYRAVMFAGAGFVEMKDLRNHGFHTRKAARRELLRMTRVSTKLRSGINRENSLHQIAY